MANEKRLVYDADFKLRLNAVIENRKRMGLPYDQLENVAFGLLDCCPTVDAVEVVRCKDCKYNDHKKAFRTEGIWCCYWGIDPDPNDFCSYGERREGE